MYINNINILYYLFLGIIGLGIGQFVAWSTVRLPDYKKVFCNLMKKKSLIIYVVDSFAFESSLIRELFPFIKDSPILVVANKRDILPKAVNDDKLREFIYRKFKQEGIEIKDVICSSAFRNYNIDEIIEAANALRNGKELLCVFNNSVM